MPHDSCNDFDLLNSTDTLQRLAERGILLENLPQQPETWNAIRQIETQLLTPLHAHFGPFHISYGFASSALITAVRKQAKLDARHPQIAPELDQHSGFELNQRGQRICKRDGMAVDLKVPGVSSEHVGRWIRDNLPFDRMYLYGEERPLHLSWAPIPTGQTWQMVKGRGGMIPRRWPS